MNRGLLGVDVFFVLSGFLIGSLLLREHARSRTLALGYFYLRRAMRILPAYFVALGITCLLLPDHASAVWANLLFVNNFLPESEQCMPWAWSLAVEEQFYIVFPVALLVALRFMRPLVFLLALCGAGLLVRAAIVHHHGIHLASVDHARVYYDALYDKPYGRFPQLLSGVIVAYLMGFTDASSILKRSPRLTKLLMVVSAAVVLGSSVAAQPIFSYGWPPFANFLYYVLSPIVFSAGVAYVLFAAVTGLAGGRRLARILSWRALYPVSQLSYSAYLIHMIVITVGLDTGAFHPARSVAAMCAYSVIVPAVTLVAAMPMYMLVEKPLMNLRDHQRAGLCFRWPVR